MDAGPLPPVRARHRRPGGPRTATSVASCCKAAARSAPIRPASTRRCTKPGWSRTGSPASRSAASIGAIIAGNAPERRLERLRDVLGHHHRAPHLVLARSRSDGDEPRQALQHLVGDADHDARPARLLHAQRARIPGCSPRGARTATAFYDTAPLRETLLRLVDFDLLNRGADPLRRRRGQRCRPAISAISTTTADRDRCRSTSWPAARCRRRCRWSRSARIATGMAAWFPTRRCSTCWRMPAAATCWSFQVDLFSARGRLPRDMMDVLAPRRRTSSTPAARAW